MGQDFQTITELVRNVKSSLEGEFYQIKVEGEISNFTRSGAGHIYFTLKDEHSAISCALFRGDAMRNPVVLKMKNGDKIQCAGSIGVYEKRGTFQIIAKWLKPVGKGDLKEQFEQLKKKLNSEGLFDLDRKKAVPQLAKRVAVITAEGAAALQDFINVYQRRSLWMDLKLFPSLVQGDAAPRNLQNALKKILKWHKKNPVDVIVFTRGGGSLEDLWAFNNEALVRDIAACPIPVVSAIGHQVDFVLTDFVADFRAETPTAAAEFLSQGQFDLVNRISHLKRRLLSSLQLFQSQMRSKLARIHPEYLSNLLLGQLQHTKERLGQRNPMVHQEKYFPFREFYQRLDDHSFRMKEKITNKFTHDKQRVVYLNSMLHSLGPKNVLKRGYTYLETDFKKIITDKKSFDSLSRDESIYINFHDGRSEAKRS